MKCQCVLWLAKVQLARWQNRCPFWMSRKWSKIKLCLHLKMYSLNSSKCGSRAGINVPVSSLLIGSGCWTLPVISCPVLVWNCLPWMWPCGMRPLRGSNLVQQYDRMGSLKQTSCTCLCLASRTLPTGRSSFSRLLSAPWPRAMANMMRTVIDRSASCRLSIGLGAASDPGRSCVTWSAGCLGEPVASCRTVTQPTSGFGSKPRLSMHFNVGILWVFH